MRLVVALALLLASIAAGFPILILFVIGAIQVLSKIEKSVEGLLASPLKFVKSLNFELSTFRFALLILLISFSVWGLLKYGLHTHGWEIGVSKIEILVSAMNFCGVMYVARGVIMLRTDVVRLDTAAAAEPAEFSQQASHLFKDASEYCERGSVLICIAFAADMFAKAFS